MLQVFAVLHHNNSADVRHQENLPMHFSFVDVGLELGCTKSVAGTKVDYFPKKCHNLLLGGKQLESVKLDCHADSSLSHLLLSTTSTQWPASEVSELSTRGAHQSPSRQTPVERAFPLFENAVMSLMSIGA